MDVRNGQAGTRNEELLEGLFRLLFQTVWGSQYDPRRSSPVYAAFLRTARLLAAALNRTEVRTADAGQRRGRLRDDVARLGVGRVIMPLQQAEAGELPRTIGDGMLGPV